MVLTVEFSYKLVLYFLLNILLYLYLLVPIMSEYASHITFLKSEKIVTFLPILFFWKGSRDEGSTYPFVKIKGLKQNSEWLDKLEKCYYPFLQG